MQLLLLGMIAAILMHDEVLGFSTPITNAWAFPLFTVAATKLGVALPFALACRRIRQRLGTPAGSRAFRRLERFMSALPIVLLALFALDLAAGWLTVVRRPWGNVILLDELVALAPTLLVLLAVWSAYYPIDCRLREATLFRRADEGLPLYPMWTRGQYLLSQSRNQVLILLAPLMVILFWNESLQLLVTQHRLAFNTALWLTPIGGVALFLFAPSLLRHVFDTVPLPPGSVRDSLTNICRQHRVGVRDLLLWRTGGNLVNAAVMGLAAPLRYVLMSDGLLDQLRQPHVEAVMAHELGHVKHHHLVWLVLAAGAAMAVCFSTADFVLLQTQSNTAMQVAVTTLAMVAWAGAFGWVSRRVERQADTFAAKHMTTHHQAQTQEETEIQAPLEPAPLIEHFSDAGVTHVIQALQRVAELNHSATTRRSWRHGSIASRQKYLTSLIGQPLTRAGVDRTMNTLKLATALILAGIAAWAAS